MKAHRPARMAEVIREVAAETILFELRDPRIKFVTVTRVEVSGDLQIAKIYVSVMGDQKTQDLALHGLTHSAGYVQSKLGSRLKTRFTPAVRFYLDEGIKKSIEVSRLINEALAQSKSSESDSAAKTETSDPAVEAAAPEESESPEPTRNTE
jgi:ribosome-binding factor A